MVRKYNHLALTVLLMLMGGMLIVGSVVASIGTTLFPFDSWFGTRAPVAAAAFGAGLMLAAFRPDENLTWVRAALLYCVIDVLYEVVYGLFFGGAHFVNGIIPLLVSILFAVLIVGLYPRRGDLVPHNPPAAHPAGAK